MNGSYHNQYFLDGETNIPLCFHCSPGDKRKLHKIMNDLTQFAITLRPIGSYTNVTQIGTTTFSKNTLFAKQTHFRALFVAVSV